MTTATITRQAVDGLTIDHKHSRDLDDAFWCRRDGDGYEVDVSIADVAAWVTPGSDMDITAKDRVETKYRAWGNKPMLPPSWSDDRLSLLEGRPRDTITVRLKLDPAGHVTDAALLLTTLTSAAKLSHADVDVMLHTHDHRLFDQLWLCKEVAALLFTNRRERGALAFYDAMSNLYADEDGVVTKYDDDFFHAQMIVQEFAILANEQMAKIAAASGMPFLYRNHQATAAAPDPGTVADQVAQAINHPQMLPALAERFHLWAKRAEYHPHALGHFGLNLAAYAHVSSPIRRYVDLVNQRVLHALIEGKPAPYTVAELLDIAADVNDFKAAQKENRDGLMKAKTIDERRSQLERQRFDGLSEEQFSKVLKRAVKDQVMPDAFAAELGARTTAGRLEVMDAYYLIFHARKVWPWVGLAVCGMLTKRPHDAVSVMGIAASRDGLVHHVDVKQFGGFYARARVTFDGRETATLVVGTGPKQKTAQAMACLLWLRCLIDGTLVDVAGVDLPLGPDIVPDVPPPAPGENFVGRLMELAQQRKVAPPTFTFVQTGPSHAPEVTCTARMGDLTAVGVAGSKKEAKQHAAKQLFGRL